MLTAVTFVPLANNCVAVDDLLQTISCLTLPMALCHLSVSYTERCGHVTLLNSMGRICRTNTRSVRYLLHKFLAVHQKCLTQFCTLDQTLPRPDSILMLLTHLGKFSNHAIKEPTVVSFQIPIIHVHPISLFLYKHLFSLSHTAYCVLFSTKCGNRQKEKRSFNAEVSIVRNDVIIPHKLLYADCRYVECL